MGKRRGRRGPPPDSEGRAGQARAAARGAGSPMAGLCAGAADASLRRSMADLGSLHMRALAEQFAKAAADENLEATLAMLAGCPSLARMPCASSLVSALHYCCASARMAPAARALLRLGCDPLGEPRAPGQDGSGAGSPMRWAASAGNPQAIEALIEAGAVPSLGDLREACRQAQGACASLILKAAPDLDPCEAGGPWERSCEQELREAAEQRRCPSNEARLMVDQALADFERRALERQAGGAGAEAEPAGSRRL